MKYLIITLMLGCTPYLDAPTLCLSKIENIGELAIFSRVKCSEVCLKYPKVTACWHDILKTSNDIYCEYEVCQ